MLMARKGGCFSRPNGRPMRVSWPSQTAAAEPRNRNESRNGRFVDFNRFVHGLSAHRLIQIVPVRCLLLGMRVTIQHGIIIGLALALGACTGDKPTPADFLGAAPAPEALRDLPPQVQSFIEEKEQLALTLAKKLGVEADGPTLEYFRLARRGRYRAASHI